MTRPARETFRGEVTAAAYLIDPTAVGEAEARDRVLSRWTSGTRLLAWPDGRWLLLLGTPETVAAERAPGLPLVGDAAGLTTPGEPVVGDVVQVPGGTPLSVPLAALPAVDLAGWLAADALPAVALVPLERAPSVEVPEPAAHAPEPDLRALAGIGRTPARAAQITGQGPVLSRFTILLVRVAAVLVAIAVVGAIVSAIARAAGGDHPSADHTPVIAVTTPAPTPTTARVPPVTAFPTDLSGLGTGYELEAPPSTSSGGGSWIPLFPLALLVLVGGLARLRRTRGTVAARTRRATAARARAATRGAGRRSRWRDAAKRWVIGSPAGGIIGRRHAKYLRSLTEDLERGRWESALPAAIALDGGGGLLSLRLPRARTSLSPAQTGGAGTVVPWGPSVAEHLRGLYRQAAGQLEREGATARAAFVLAVLLHDAPAAVALLERAGDPALAAEIAEARDLDPSLAVRLWWQAGRRDRAVLVARARGAFAAAVVRLEKVDPAQAHELRAAWVESARDAGDAVTAVEAAWPDSDLRRRALPDIQAGLDAGGPAAGRLLARFLSGDWDTRPLAGAAVDLLSAPTPVEAALRTGFLQALGERPVSDATLDRRLCSAAALTTLRDDRALAGVPDRAAKAVVGALRRRADPLLAADLPTWSRAARPTGAPLDVDLGGAPGLTPVWDAVVLSDGSTLAALGELGLRWLTASGAVRAQWSIPVHRLVPADHGRSALLVRNAGELAEVHRLDLTDRRATYWATLRVRAIVPSFDGGTLVTVDDDGIALLDTLVDRPRVIWRELSKDEPVLALARTPTRLTAVAVAAPPPPSRARTPDVRPFELFDWDLPSMTLRLRRRFTPIRNLQQVLATVGDAVQVGPAVLGADGVTHLRGWSDPRFEPVPLAHRIVADADTFATVAPAPPSGFVATVRVEGHPPLTVRGPAAPEDVRIRRHGDLLTVLDARGGRVIGVDVVRGEVVALTRTGV